MEGLSVSRQWSSRGDPALSEHLLRSVYCTPLLCNLPSGACTADLDKQTSCAGRGWSGESHQLGTHQKAERKARISPNMYPPRRSGCPLWSSLEFTLDATNGALRRLPGLWLSGGNSRQWLPPLALEVMPCRRVQDLRIHIDCSPEAVLGPLPNTRHVSVLRARSLSDQYCRLLVITIPSVCVTDLTLPDGSVTIHCHALCRAVASKKAVSHRTPRAGILISGRAQEPENCAGSVQSGRVARRKVMRLCGPEGARHSNTLPATERKTSYADTQTRTTRTGRRAPSSLADTPFRTSIMKIVLVATAVCLLFSSTAMGKKEERSST
jgi:hypothetical protein